MQRSILVNLLIIVNLVCKKTDLCSSKFKNNCMKTTTLLVASLFGYSAFTQITVPETTKSFYGIVEATWCGLCGQYGLPYTADIINQTEPKAVYVSLHKSSTSFLYSLDAANLATSFGAFGQPVFTVNGDNLGGHSGTIVNTCVTAINNYYQASDASVNAGFEYGIVGDSIYVHTKTTFFQDLTGEYYMGIYVYEDSVFEWQVNYDPGIADMDIWHNHVLRSSFNGHFGQQIANGTMVAGTSFNRNAVMAIDPAWDPAQLHVFTIVWKKNGDAFEFVNANDAGTTITGTVDVSDGESRALSVYPNPATDKIIISGMNSAEPIQVQLFDISGSLVLEQNVTDQLDISALQAGTYLLRANINGTILTYRVLKY